MSLAKNRNHRAARETSAAAHELPLAKGLLGLVATFVVAALITIAVGSIGWLFFIISAAGALAVTCFARLRSLYLLVVSIPVLFTVAIVLTSWVLSIQAAPKGASPFSTTSLLSAAFPFIERFPWLLIVFLLCATLAVVRLWRHKNVARTRDAKAQVARRAEQETNERTTNERLSVAELIARNRREAEGSGEALPQSSPRRRTRARELDREVRRRRQAEEREQQARERVEKSRSSSEELKRAHEERVAQARSYREAREARERGTTANSAEYDDSDFAPRRPDPARRAGDVGESREAETTKPYASKAKPKSSFLEDNLYDED
ncbi:DUF6542 domain-containing protein [Corynebacterium sp. HMSC076D02]|uniref:DUF6542 domain-containing protein n=1 Tax=Corynebacterium sp. HMSC076D02 TaxID=1739439 RepID=UPI0008A5A579|nr:DUF6542 domain-containing protein [Corynebacterium sp. HMSC076D02]OFQ43748.1 hypothetical protein HMPREF2935_08690 [Corynebacterium sp. HMSC076D02]